MQNKTKKFLLFVIMAGFVAYMPDAHADDADVFVDAASDVAEYSDDADLADDIADASADAVANYEVAGSLFQQITDLEQEKVLMQLEKERAQLDLELDRLAAEKIKLHMEIDTLSGRAEQQQQEFEMERAKLENETAKLELEKQNLLSGDASSDVSRGSSSGRKKSATAKNDDDADADELKIVDKYKLINVIGAGNQLQATLADMDSGQNKRISVGRVLDGFVVKTISLDEGVVFEKDGKTQTLNVASVK